MILNHCVFDHRLAVCFLHWCVTIYVRDLSSMGSYFSKYWKYYLSITWMIFCEWNRNKTFMCFIFVLCMYTSMDKTNKFQVRSSSSSSSSSIVLTKNQQSNFAREFSLSFPHCPNAIYLTTTTKVLLNINAINSNKIERILWGPATRASRFNIFILYSILSWHWI